MKWSVILLRVLDGEKFIFKTDYSLKKKVINESFMTNSKVFSSGENVLNFVWMLACDPRHTCYHCATKDDIISSLVLPSLNYDRLQAQDQQHYHITMIHQVPIKSLISPPGEK